MLSNLSIGSLAIFKKQNSFYSLCFYRTSGKNGYMTWDEIKEIEKSEFGYIGHHSHTHEYLVDMTDLEFENDIETASKIFKKKLGYIQNIFLSFGEYSLYMKNYISKKFELAFGQHSGVIDINKDKFELPRFQLMKNMEN